MERLDTQKAKAFRKAWKQVASVKDFYKDIAEMTTQEANADFFKALQEFCNNEITEATFRNLALLNACCTVAVAAFRKLASPKEERANMMQVASQQVALFDVVLPAEWNEIMNCYAGVPSPSSDLAVGAVHVKNEPATA